MHELKTPLENQSEEMKPMACWQCPRYSRKERRCLEGKTNPKNLIASMEVAEVLGVAALCHYNLHRDGIALRVFFPNSPITRKMTALAASKKRRRARKVVT